MVFLNNRNETIFFVNNSGILSTKAAKQAHEVNPVKIELGINKQGSYYNPGKSKIVVSLNWDAMNLMLSGDISVVPQNKRKMFKEEFKPHRIKSAISHELSHWISDSLHNRHITNVINKAREFQDPNIIKMGKSNVNMTHFEIDALIHGIKQLRIEKRDIWDKLTFDGMFQLYTALGGVDASIQWNNGLDMADEWKKTIIKRMAREKLLGKNMRKFKTNIY